MAKQVKVVEKTLVEKLLESSNQLSMVVSKLLDYNVYMDVYVKDETNSGKRLKVRSADIPVAHLGIAQFIFASFNIGSFGVIYVDEEKNEARFTLHASYTHPGGGSNGHHLAIGDRPISLEFDGKTNSWYVKL